MLFSTRKPSGKRILIHVHTGSGELTSNTFPVLKNVLPAPLGP